MSMVTNQNRLSAYFENLLYFLKSQSYDTLQMHLESLECLKRIIQVLFKPHYI